jgi:hypothetical protein
LEKFVELQQRGLHACRKDCLDGRQRRRR